MLLERKVSHEQPKTDPIAMTVSLGSVKARRPLAFSVAALLSVLASAARGGVTVTYQQVGPNVVFTATGSINTTDLTNTGNSANGAFLDGLAGRLQSSPVGGPDEGRLWNGGGFTGPTSFGITGFTSGSQSGDTFGVRATTAPFDGVNVAASYVSGAPINGMLTIPGTIAGLGLAPSVTYTWGTGPNADFFTIQAFSDCSISIDSIVDRQVTFSGSMTGLTNPVWTWDFGDGNGGSGQSTSHTYTMNGSYLVTLTVDGDGGLQATCMITTPGLTPVELLSFSLE